MAESAGFTDAEWKRLKPYVACAQDLAQANDNVRSAINHLPSVRCEELRTNLHAVVGVIKVVLEQVNNEAKAHYPERLKHQDPLSES